MIASLVCGFIGYENFVGPQGILDKYGECRGFPPGHFSIDTDIGGSILDDIRGQNRNGFQMMERSPGIAVEVMFGMFGLAVLWLYLLRTFTRVMVWGTLLLSVFVLLAVAGIALAYGLSDLAYAVLAIAAIKSLFLLAARKSINICADMMQLACEALLFYPSILASHALLGLMMLVACVATFAFMVMTQFNITGFTGPECVDIEFADYIKHFQSLNWCCLCWFVGTMGSARLFVSAFVSGQWYFHREEDRVPHATTKALLLVFSKSLGTVAFSGLITAFINWAKRRVQKMKRKCNPCMCLLGYLLGCLLSMLEFLNAFATVLSGM